MRDGFVDLVLLMEGVWWMDVMLERGLDVDGECGVGEEFREELRGESRLSLLKLGSKDGLGAVARVTILMPRLVLVLAGMKSVVCLFSAGMAMRWGWLALHPTVVSCVPVE